MNAIQEFVRRLVRGPRASACLGRLGIDARRFWLLVDLFGELSERGEMLDQLGRNGVALQFMAWLYGGVAGLMGLVMVSRQPAPAAYLSLFLALTAILLLAVLLSEAGNSLVNPAEGMILAHQPIDGATYTAAKLTHLARIVLYLVPAINAIPAVAGLRLKGVSWFYPFFHLLAGVAVGVVAALFCCALYGWLIRLVPASRLKAAGQLAGTIPFLVIVCVDPLRKALAHTIVLLPSRPAARWGIVLALGAAVFAIVVLGIRSLSADYLIRVSSIVHGQRGKPARSHKSWTGELVGVLFGGPPARAGFAYVCQMARRDYQFRRQVLPFLVFAGLGWIPLVAGGCRIDPFSGRFTTAHLLPHIFGLLLFFICFVLTYGNDFKGAWVFLLAPATTFRGFVHGIYAALWVPVVVLPHAILLLLFAWQWGAWHGVLFVAYSAAACSVYLALELRLIDGVPFSKQVDPRRGAGSILLMMLGGAAMALAVAFQYLFVFNTPGVAAAVAIVVAVAAYLLTRSSLHALERNIHYNLAVRSAGTGKLYEEIEV